MAPRCDLPQVSGQEDVNGGVSLSIPMPGMRIQVFGDDPNLDARYTSPATDLVGRYM